MDDYNQFLKSLADKDIEKEVKESGGKSPEERKKHEKRVRMIRTAVSFVLPVLSMVFLILGLTKSTTFYAVGAVLACVSAGYIIYRIVTSPKNHYGEPDIFSMLPQIILTAVAIIASVIIAIGAVNIVSAGEADIVISSPAGNNGEVFDQGWYFNSTFLLSDIETIRYNTQTAEFIGGDNDVDSTGCITVMSKDGSTINIDISVTYHIPTTKIKDLRYTYGADWSDTIINQAVRSIPRVICAEYDATDFISNNRASIENALITGLTTKISSYDMLIVDSVQIKEFRIPHAVTNAVQAKLIAEQEKAKALIEKETLETRAEAQANADLITAQNKADILLIEAQAKADAIAKLQSEFTSEKEYLQYLYLQALTDPNSNVQYVVPNGSTIVVGA